MLILIGVFGNMVSIAEVAAPERLGLLVRLVLCCLWSTKYRGAVVFNFISSFGYSIPHAYIAIYGFLKAKRGASSMTASLSLVEEAHLT